MKEEIVHTALDNLMKNTGIEGFYSSNQKKDLDGEVKLVFANVNELFKVDVRKEIRFHQLDLISNLAAANKNFILIAETIFPKIKEEFRKRHIAYLDSAGNFYLQKEYHHLWIEGHKKVNIKAEKTNRAFSATGLRVVYHFLINEKFLNQPQRNIAEEAGVALGNIKEL